MSIITDFSSSFFCSLSRNASRVRLTPIWSSSYSASFELSSCMRSSSSCLRVFWSSSLCVLRSFSVASSAWWRSARTRATSAFKSSRNLSLAASAASSLSCNCASWSCCSFSFPCKASSSAVMPDIAILSSSVFRSLSRKAWSVFLTLACSSPCSASFACSSCLWCLSICWRAVWSSSSWACRSFSVASSALLRSDCTRATSALRSTRSLSLAASASFSFPWSWIR
mmetsp:Transcript_114325/g.318251  ORF Transcript_114325/g.318251 Transcript_114325/m.318251 type:complete len:226 (-) Transcript_114325:2044-2721(-)